MEEYKDMLKDCLVCYCRGSKVYGTYKEGVSDEDFLSVVPDRYADFLSQFPKGIGQYSEDGVSDYEFVSESNFLKMIDGNNIVALEAIFVPNGMWRGNEEKYREYRDRFVLDKWKLRESVSSICSNSWVKAKMKLTVEKDYNLRIAQKSLFHSLRIYMFGVQIAENGTIVDFECAKELWRNIAKVENPRWDYYKATYQQKFNELRSKMVELCPKPEEKFKK